MTYEDLKEVIDMNTVGLIEFYAILTAVDDYIEASNGAKPDVMCCKELLAQMSKEENEALGKAGYYDLHKRETHANQKYCLAIVMQMLEERKAL